jgi:transposase
MVFIRKVISRGCAYAQLVRTERDGKRIRTKVLKHLGPWNKLGDLLSKPTADQIEDFSSFDHGSVSVLHNLCEELRLQKIIDSNIFKGAGLNAGILSEIIIINHCVNPSSKVKMPDWFSKTTLPKILNIDIEKINKDNLIKLLDYYTDDKIEQIHSSVVDRLIELFGIKKDCLMYDITSTYFEGNKCEDAVFGYSRDGKRGTRQVNFGLLVSRMGKFPLLFRYFKGNTTDVTTVSETALKAKELLQLTKTSIVMDRGMLSEDNVKDLDELGLDYIICLKKTNDVVKKMLTIKIENCELIDEDKQLYGFEFTEEHNKKMKKYVVCISKQKQEEDKEKRLNQLNKVETELLKLQHQTGKGKYKDRDEIIAKRGEIIKGVKKYFKINHPKKELAFTYERDIKEITKQEQLDGKYAILCSDPETSIEEIIEVYKDKDKVEKAFRVIKSYIHVRPIRHWKPQRVKAHVFLCVIAYLIQKVLEYKYDKEQKTTAQTLLHELNGIKKIIYAANENQYEKLTTMNDNQIEILKKLSYFPL